MQNLWPSTNQIKKCKKWQNPHALTFFLIDAFLGKVKKNY
jgi:hypothetical protein